MIPKNQDAAPRERGPALVDNGNREVGAAVRSQQAILTEQVTLTASKYGLMIELSHKRGL